MTVLINVHNDLLRVAFFILKEPYIYIPNTYYWYLHQTYYPEKCIEEQYVILAPVNVLFGQFVLLFT